nr:AraC family transcriptional regulator [uncultured Ottowia sp.]
MTGFPAKNAAFPSTALPLLRAPDIVAPCGYALGADYIASDSRVTAATPLLRGCMQTRAVQDGLELYCTDVQDLRTLRTSNMLAPAIRIVLLLEGETELCYGGRRLRLQASQAGRSGPRAAVIAFARADRFIRQWQSGRRERKLVLTLFPRWLEQSGALRGPLAAFAACHLALSPWQPSARALALAEQLHCGCPLPEHLHPLWYASQCASLALQALACVSAPACASPAVLPAASSPGLPPRLRPHPRLHMRLTALRDWLKTPAADGLDAAAIARHAGMSEAHLQRHFPAVAGGLTPARYVRAQRLLRARLALEEGRASVAQAAQMAGYRSATHFAAVFRQHFGLLPSLCKGGG